MERFRFITVALVSLCFVPVPCLAQEAATGARSVALMGGTFTGAFDSARNVPMLASRYRARTARLGVLEAELGAGRTRDGGCLTAVSNGTFLDCDQDPRTMFVGGLSWVVSAQAGELRPYAQAGIGGVLSSDFDAGAYGVAGAGMAVRVIRGFSARAEVGHRFNGSGGGTHVLVGIELDVTRR